MENWSYLNVFADCYHYMENFANGAGDSDYWQNAALTANDIFKRYEHTNVHDLAADMLSAAYSQLQRTIPNGKL